MHAAEADSLRLKYYSPSRELVGFITERLQYERLELRKTRAGRELSQADKNLRRKLATDKVRVLDKIFQAMANLSFFFESISAHKELQELFDDDLIDLLGLKQERHESQDLQNGKHYVT